MLCSFEYFRYSYIKIKKLFFLHLLAFLASMISLNNVVSIKFLFFTHFKILVGMLSGLITFVFSFSYTYFTSEFMILRQYKILHLIFITHFE